MWLTNRVHPTRANESLVALRAKLHDAVMEATGVKLEVQARSSKRVIQRVPLNFEVLAPTF